MTTGEKFPIVSEGERTGGFGREMESCTGNADSFIVELVSLVSEAVGEDPLEMPPLADTIDPEAIQQVLKTDSSGTARVSFQYAGCEVSVTGNGEIVVLSESE